MLQRTSRNRVAKCKLHAANTRPTYIYRLVQLLQYLIHPQFTTRSLLNPDVFTPPYVLHTYVLYRKWIQVIILYWLVGHVYTTCTICDYWRHTSAKRSWRIYFDTSMNIFDSIDSIVRNDNSSVHVEGSYGLCKWSKLQTKLIDNWSTQYCPAFYG
jgi:hypothetical protein